MGLSWMNNSQKKSLSSVNCVQECQRSGLNLWALQFDFLTVPDPWPAMRIAWIWPKAVFLKQGWQIKCWSVDFLGCFKYYNCVTMNWLKSRKKYSFLDLNQNCSNTSNCSRGCLLWSRIASSSLTVLDTCHVWKIFTSWRQLLWAFQ